MNSPIEIKDSSRHWEQEVSIAPQCECIPNLLYKATKSDSQAEDAHDRVKKDFSQVFPCEFRSLWLLQF